MVRGASRQRLGRYKNVKSPQLLLWKRNVLVETTFNKHECFFPIPLWVCRLMVTEVGYETQTRARFPACTTDHRCQSVVYQKPSCKILKREKLVSFFVSYVSLIENIYKFLLSKYLCQVDFMLSVALKRNDNFIDEHLHQLQLHVFNLFERVHYVRHDFTCKNTKALL